MILTLLTCWIYLEGTVGSSVSKRFCEKVSEVTSLKKLLQFETILRTLNVELSSASGGTDPCCWNCLAPKKRTPIFKILHTGLQG